MKLSTNLLNQKPKKMKKMKKKIGSAPKVG